MRCCTIVPRIFGVTRFLGGRGLKYSAFISYNHRDRRWAVWLHRALERYRIPKRLQGRDSAFGPLSKRLPPAFRDRDELASSSDLAASVRQGLEDSAFLVVVCSPNGAASRWVNEEIRTFIALGRRDRIRLIIVDGEPGSADPALNALPPAIMEGATGEPLAADVRPGQDGRQGAVLKILAGLLDVPYDELRQREAARRQRRLAIIAGASTLGFVVTAGLAVAALIARQQAEEARKIAEARTVTAERTLNFVKGMFRVSDPTNAQGEGDKITAREIVDRGARMLETGLEKEPAAKADLGVTLAEVYNALGLYQRGYDKARQSFQQAQALLDTRGVTPAMRSRVLVGLGQLEGAGGDGDAADKLLRAALAVDRAQGDEGRADVARDLEALGTNAYYAGKLAEARKLVNDALAIRTAVEGENSPSVTDNRNTLANIAYAEGDLKGVEALYRGNLARDERVLGPKHPDLGITLNNLARVLLDQRRFAEAGPLLERAIAVVEGQRGKQASDLVYFYANLAIVRRFTGRGGEADGLFDHAVALARAIEHPMLGPVLADEADHACQSRQVAEGIRLADEAGKVIARDYPDNAWRGAWVLNVRGGCLMRAGKAAEGRALVAQSLPVLTKRWAPGTLYGEAARGRGVGAGR
ncbi:MAG: hypothetical protein B7Z39_02420 [Novosphingobium sp. 12-64-8]|nr:MAG: hypothetical protein B7Z39_02420 [Novosphingobium sp. 12-64-8]